MKKDYIKKGDFVNAEAKKPVQEVKKTKKKDKTPNFFQKFGAKCKDVFSELKKVSWPSFGKVVKNTGIVLVVVLAFLIVITAFDYGLMQLLTLITGGKA